MKSTIRLTLLTTLLLAVAAVSIPPASAHDSGCIDYKLLFTDGHGVEGTKCAGDNPDLHTPNIDITCGDKFKDGKIKNVNDHTMGAFYIVNHDDKKDNKQTTCGADFDFPPTPPACDSIGLEAELLPGDEIELTLADYSLATASELHRTIGADPEASLGAIIAPSGPLYTDSTISVGEWHLYRLAISDPFEVECSTEIFVPEPDYVPTCDDLGLTAELLADGTVRLGAATPPADFDVKRSSGAAFDLIGSGQGSDNPLFIDLDPVRGAVNNYTLLYEDGPRCFVEVDVPVIVLDCEALNPHATLLLNGSVLLTFNALASADSIVIGRDDGSGGQLLATLGNSETSYLDDTTIPGTTVLYGLGILVDRDLRGPCFLELIEIPVPPHPDCEEFDLIAWPQDGGSIELTYNLPDGARGVRVLRDGVFIGGVAQPGELYNDTTAIIGETYVYTLEVWYPHARAPEFACDVEVTSVPVFGNALASLLAISLGALAYVGVKRRRM